MSAPFDPYIKWLGIRDSERPPNHYVLLGLTLFEGEPEVIEAAADRQMAHIRTYQTGAQSKASQQVLNELAAARLCLLTEDKKISYDNLLRNRLAAQQKSAQSGAQPAVSSSTSQPQLRSRVTALSGDPALPAGQPQRVEPTLPSFTVSPSPRSKAGPKTKGPSGKAASYHPLVWGASAIGGMLLVAIAAFVFTRGNSPEPSVVVANSRTGESHKPRSERQPKVDKLPSATTAKSWEPGPSTPLSEPEAAPLHRPNAALPSKPNAGDHGPQPVAPKREPKEASPEIGNMSTKPSEQVSVVEPAPANTKLPVPDSADQQKTLNGLREIMKDEYAKSKKPQEQAALAERLLRMANEAGEDVVERYVLLSEAAALSSAAGDLPVVLRALRKLDEGFEGDRWDLRSIAVKRALQTGDKTERTPQVQAAVELLEEALVADRYAEALQISEMIVGFRQLDPQSRKAWNERRNENKGQEKAWQAVRVSLETLRSAPNEPDENLVVGRFFALVKQDWPRGLPYLVKGSDAALQTLSGADLAEPLKSAEQVQLADGWWDAADSAASFEKTSLQTRATHWYARALSELTGTDRVKAINRIQQAPPTIELLSLIDLKKDVIAGNWQMSEGTLLSSEDQYSRLQIPQPVFEEYVLETVIRRKSASEGMCGIGLAVGKSQVVLVLDDLGDRHLSGFHMLDGVAVNDHPESMRGIAFFNGEIFKDNEQARIKCRVTITGITVIADGRTILEWTGDPARLTNHDKWAVSNPHSLFFGTYNEVHQVKSMRLTPLFTTSSKPDRKGQ